MDGLLTIRRWFWAGGAAVLCAAWIVGCSADYYRDQADHDSYSIIRDKQRSVTGAPGPFSIDSPRPFEDELSRRNFQRPTNESTSRPNGASAGPDLLPPVVLAAGPRANDAPQMMILFAPRASDPPVGALIDAVATQPDQPADVRSAGEPTAPAAAATSQADLAATQGDLAGEMTPVVGGEGLFIEPNRWPASVQRIDLITALRLAAANNLSYQAGKETVYNAALALTTQQHVFENQFFGTVNATKTMATVDHRTGTVDTILGVNRTFSTGGTMAANITNHLMEVFTDPTGKAANSTLNLTLNQPLLRGAGYRVVMEPLIQADRSVIYAVRTFERSKRQLAVQIATQFYGVLQNGDTVANQRGNYANLILARRQQEELAKAGRLPAFEVDQARQSELAARNSWQVAVQAYNQSVDDFRQLLGLPITWPVVPDPAVLGRLTRGGLSLQMPSADRAVQAASANRLDLKNAVDQVDDAERKIYVAADALKMGLNVQGAMAVPTQSGSRMTDLSLRNGLYTWSAVVDLPLDKLNERNAYRTAIVNLNVARRAMIGQIDTISEQIRLQLRTVTQARASYEIQENAVRLAQRRVDSTTMLIQAGRAQTRDLLDSQASLVDAQNALSAALVGYHIARLSLLRDMEVLQVEPAGLTYHDPTTEH